MDLHTHFQLLGLRRGSSEGDMRKAYHKKALEFHPDRNPSGADIFKKIQAAYESLQRHYKVHGGNDVVGAGGSTGGYACSARSHSSATTRMSEPLFTEEELFGDGLKRSSSTTEHPPRRYPHRPFRQSDAKTTTPPTFAEHHTKASEDRERAHRGHQPPVSGYDPFHGESDEMDAFLSQAKHFADMEQRKAKLARGAADAYATSSTAPASDGTGGGRTASKPPNDGVGGGASQCNQASTSKGNGNGRYQPCHQQLSDEWVAHRKEAEDLERGKAAMEEAERRSRKLELERETREEWARMTAEMDAKRLREEAATAAREATVNIEQHRKTNHQLHALHKEKLELKQLLFSRRMPLQGELARMTPQELFILKGVMESSLSDVAQLLRERLRPTALCCVCQVAPKEESSGAKFHRFDCSHTATCAACGRDAFMCPICGADNLDLMRDA